MDFNKFAAGRSRNWHDDVFFGLHFDLHAAETDTALGRNLSVEHLVGQLEKVRPDYVQCDCKGHPGLTSYPTAVGIPAPHIEKDSLKIWREATRVLGIPLGVHFSGVWDTAILKRHPEWGRLNLKEYEESKGSPGVDGQAKPENFEDRDKDNTCPLSPYTDEYMIPQILEIIDRYDVDGFWIDGENWTSLPCYCDRCTSEFVRWSGISNVPVQKGEEGWNEWLAFSRRNFEEHVRKVANAVHKRKPSCTVCSNWMYTVRQPDEPEVPVDYLSGDFDWIWSTGRAWPEARFMDNRGLSWDLMAWGFTSYGPMKNWVFKSAPALCQEAAVVMASGGSFMVYDQPNRTGELVGWHMDRLAEVGRFCRARQPYCQHSRSVPQIAILHAKEHYYLNNGPLYQMGSAEKPVEGALQALLENGYHADILTGTALMERIDQYPICIAAEQDALPEELRLKLEAYVFNGGNLIVTGAEQTGKFDTLAGVMDTGGLAGEEHGQGIYIPDGEEACPLIGSWRLVRGNPGTVVEKILFSRDRGANEQDSGSPAAVMTQYGKGRIALVFGPVFEAYYDSHYPGMRRFVKRLVEAFENENLVRVEAPLCIQTAVRETGNTRMIHFINSGTNKALSPRNGYIEDVPAAGPVRVTLKLEKRPAAVFLAPSFQPVSWSFSGEGFFSAEIGHIGIHDILVIQTDV
jgi:hypothetical protein